MSQHMFKSFDNMFYFVDQSYIMFVLICHSHINFTNPNLFKKC